MPVYFMQPTDGGPIKIGCSKDLDTRRKQLESDYRRPLALLATLPGDRLEIRFVDIPEEEERRIVEAVGRLDGKGFHIHCEEGDSDA